VAKTAESDKVIGELRSIQNELKALEETLQKLTEVLFPEKTQNQKILKKQKSRKKISNPKTKIIPKTKRNSHIEKMK
jgi:hypothetical protein